ncbi:protein FAM204A isoform X2 [Scleropages formosus]|uniref:protein FAM204A isoform X2 n=1 Tax=Scleropages formosus TaxID=113540 RepID=UPI0010FAB0DB|nr:protein FAM204A isoform X2 [Scleropages formosus]
MYSGLLPRGLCGDSDRDVRDAVEHDEEGKKGGDDGGGECCSTSSSSSSSSSRVRKVEQEEEKTHDNSALPLSGDSAGNFPGVSPRMLQKFAELRDKNKEIKMQLSKVRQQRRKRHKKAKTNKKIDSTLESDEKGNLKTEREEHWNELKQYFGVNDRFHPPPCSRPNQKTGLERSIDSAIAEGDYEKAEELSNSLATREVPSDVHSLGST